MKDKFKLQEIQDLADTCLLQIATGEADWSDVEDILSDIIDICKR